MKRIELGNLKHHIIFDLSGQVETQVGGHIVDQVSDDIWTHIRIDLWDTVYWPLNQVLKDELN